MKQKNKPIIIAIGGRSCSGKSSVIKELIKTNDKILRINQDDFFKKKAPLYEGFENSEVPQATMFDKLFEAIKKLKENKSTIIPSKRRTEIFDRKVKPTKIIMVEGFLIFTDKELNKLFDKKIFLDVNNKNLIERRCARRMQTKGLPGKIAYYNKVVIPFSKKFEKPQKDAADIIIDANRPFEEVFVDVKNYLKTFYSL